jgi:hypothetical protein
MDIPSTLTVGNHRTITAYRIETDGSLTECKSSVAGSQITFETNHFSTYLFALKDTTEVADNSDNNTNKDASVDSNGVQASSTTNTDTTETVNQKVVPPKTAESANLMVMLLIMALGIGFVGTAMRRQNRII